MSKKNILISAQNTLVANDFYLSVYNGDISGYSIINKFGRNPAVGTTLVPVSISGNYQTPIAAQSLEIVSSSALDTLAGTGAEKVIIEGLDANFVEQTEEISLNGITAVPLTKTFIRVFRTYVSQSGTYASELTGSHFGIITLRGVGIGATWVSISVDGAFGIGQSQIAAYTIPAGYTAYLLSKNLTVEANKPASFYFFKRENANDVVAPYSGVMRLFEENDGIQTPFSVNLKAPINMFPEKTDIGFLGKVSVGTASVSVDFQLLLIKN